MGLKSRRAREPEKTCKCGAKTPEQHVQYVLAGYPTHTYGGPVKKR